MSAPLVWLLICGIAVNVWLGWKIGKALGYCIAMFVYAVSYTRWTYSVGKVHGFRECRLPIWSLIPYTTISRWWFFVVHDASDMSARSSGGVWEGIGNWTVFPVRQVEEPSHE